MPTQNSIILWGVDMQVDFMLPGGKLYVPGAEKLIPNIERLVDTAREGRALMIASGCQHSENDQEFKDFPPHCIRGTKGAELIPESMAKEVLRVPNDAEFEIPAGLLDYQQIFIEKQTLDVFKSKHTAGIVRALPPSSNYFVFGVVTEYCVRFAGKGLLERGHRVSIIQDAIETLNPSAGRETLDDLGAAGVQFIFTEEALERIAAAQHVF